jgi:hypothetical protein
MPVTGQLAIMQYGDKEDGCLKCSLQCVYLNIDHLCGLVVRDPGYIFRGLGSIPGITRFSEK